MTRCIPLFLTLCWSLLFSGCLTSEERKSALVNPFIGTGGHGHTYPGATVPFGMVQLSPDTRLTGWDGCGGYHYSDTIIHGFSHTHLQGTGVSDYGDILFAPCTQFNPEAKTWSDRYASRFSHENESAHAGYYQVYLQDQKIQVELTATERVGIHRYSLQEEDTLTLMVDMAHRDALTHYSIYPLNDSMLVGHRVSDNWAREQHTYFAAKFDHPFEWRDQMSEITNTGLNDQGHQIQDLEYVPVFACDFGVIKELNAEVALSFVSIDGALANLEAEAILPDFESYQAAAENTWDEQLERLEAKGGTSEERETFYSALYHCFTTPNVANDVTGEYRGTDLQIHRLEANEGEHYTVFSLWDTFRALHPLLNWIEPMRSRDFVRTMLRMYDQGGQLPVWELAANYTGCMIGYHSVPVIGDAVSWGIDSFDQHKALQAMVQAADSAHLGLPSYAALGYIPLDAEHESVSKTLEYAFDDACIARFAGQIDQESEISHSADGTLDYSTVSRRFGLRALNYRNLFNKTSGFFQPKRSAAWLENFEPREVNFNYTEANGWQYNFFVPHDIQGHIQLMGGADAYRSKLMEMFTTTSETTGRNQADITGLIGQYAHGNEPSHHMAYLFPFVGRHNTTSELVSQIRAELYSTQPDGLSGNEDCGQMSAWYVWSALGMYPVCPGEDNLVIGTPLFEEVIVRPNTARSSHPKLNAVKLLRKGDGKYVKDVQFSKVDSSVTALQTPVLYKSDLLNGGVIEFQCQQEPTEFGMNNSDWPNYEWNDEDFVPVPVIEAPRTFVDSCEVRLTLPMASRALQVQYQLTPCDQSWSENDWVRYESPFQIDHEAMIHARTLREDGSTSSTVQHRWTQVNHGYVVQSITPFDAQYAAGGDQALLDGITGGHQFQTGDWQGYWGTDVVIDIDLGGIKNVTQVSVGALRDIRPWIFYPKEVKVEGSLDGVNWTAFGRSAASPGNGDASAERHSFAILGQMSAQWMRINVLNSGPLPVGHLGAGNPSWVFLDEINISASPNL